MPKFESLFTRVLVALIAIPFILWMTMLGGYYFFFLIAVISSFALFEFYGIAEAKGAAPLKTLGLMVGVIINGVFVYERFQVDIYQFVLTHFDIHSSMFSQHQLLSVVLLKFLLVTMLIELFRTKGSPTLNIAATISGVMIISLCFGTLIFLRELFPYGFPVYKFFAKGYADDLQLAQINRWGGYTVIAVFASIWMCDTAAYFAGSAFGKHRLFERVSPKKTWEGALFGFLFSIITMVASKILVLAYLSYLHAIVIGVLIGIFGQLGDLIESRFKRDAGVKDSSHIIPGHGGVYDRFDSLVYISPIVYLYIDFIVLS
ncbi:MAG: phosphatidate cytidylyltransferase [Ignavibacteriae bacterium]|nr:MAG: phosphatidate cytidylyltransferase [Ignavibacteriota bacterium]